MRAEQPERWKPVLINDFRRTGEDGCECPRDTEQQWGFKDGEKQSDIRGTTIQ